MRGANAEAFPRRFYTVRRPKRTQGVGAHERPWGGREVIEGRPWSWICPPQPPLPVSITSRLATFQRGGRRRPFKDGDFSKIGDLSKRRSKAALASARRGPGPCFERRRLVFSAARRRRRAWQALALLFEPLHARLAAAAGRRRQRGGGGSRISVNVAEFPCDRASAAMPSLLADCV